MFIRLSCRSVPRLDPDNEEVPSGPQGEGWVSGVLSEDNTAGVDCDEDGVEEGDDDKENEGIYVICVRYCLADRETSDTAVVKHLFKHTSNLEFTSD